MNVNDPTPATETPTGNDPEPAPTAAGGPDAPPVAPARQERTAAPEPPPTQTSVLAIILGVLFYAAIGLAVFVYIWGTEPLQRNWPYIAGGLAVLLLAVSLPATRRKFAHADAKWRIGVTLLISTIATLAFIVVVFLFEPDTQAAFLRLIFIMVVCSLPAVMYYLFIATKKYSLLNEFIMNLGRLGLLYPSRVPPPLVCAGLRDETKTERRKRIKTYLQKFESVYGKVPTNLSTFVIKPTDLSAADDNDGDEIEDAKVEGSFTDVFTFETTLPVLIATLLIALGWLITLPPWDGKLNLFSRAQAGQLATAIETQSNNTQAEPTPAPTAAAQESSAPAAAQQTAEERQQAAEERQHAEAKEAKSEAKVDNWLGVFSPVQSPVRFAFIGAYFFALQLLFRRYVRRDLRASAYVNISLRIILAMIGIWVVSSAVKIAPNDWLLNEDGTRETSENLLLVLGFVVGVFPRVAWQVVQAALKRVASIAVPSLQTQLPVSDLDGLTVWHEARFEEEDIENIPNMATADIVDLMINTRLPPDRIIDWVDQAILYTHLGPEEEEGKKTRRKILREHGIRTASALVEAYNRSAQHDDREEFEKVLPGEGRNQIRSLVDAVGTNPNLKLIQTWRGLMPHVHETDAAHTPAEPPGKSVSRNGQGAQGSTQAQAGDGTQAQSGAQSSNGSHSQNGGGPDKNARLTDTPGGQSLDPADAGARAAHARDAAAQQSSADGGSGLQASGTGQGAEEDKSSADKKEGKDQGAMASEEAAGENAVESA